MRMILIVALLGTTSLATVANEAIAATEGPAPASTTVTGTAFGSKFAATYVYAKKEANEDTVFVFFGNGQGGGCESTGSNETAFVGMNHPARIGTFSVSPTKAFYSGVDLEPRAFSSFKIDVKNVTPTGIVGAVELVSASGKIAGEFNAALCPGTN